MRSAPVPTLGATATAQLRDPRDAEVALFQRFPELIGRLPWAPIGRYPTPVEPFRLADVPHAAEIWVKREDISAERYGGNKVRTLEGHLGRALARGDHTLWATGAFGSNHALCAALHGARLGLAVGVSLFPQPPTVTAKANLRATLAMTPAIYGMPHVTLLPWAMGRLMLRRGEAVMTPGGAIPIGALGHVSAGLELAGQIAAGQCPAFRHLVVAVGSTCTSAGLVLGLALAKALGIGPASAPHVHAVGIGPWPVTSKAAILWLARRTLRHLEALLGHRLPVAARELGAGLTTVGDRIGKGYGFPTLDGAAAARAFAAAGGPALDEVYTAKSGAGLLAQLDLDGPQVFWATKSTRPLAAASADQIARATPQMRAWLARPEPTLERVR